VGVILSQTYNIESMKPMASPAASATRPPGASNPISTSGSPPPKAVRAAVPNARFGMPDVASHTAWFTTIADKLGAISNCPTIALSRTNYYFTRPPSNPKGNVTDLLKPNPRVANDGALAFAAAQRLHTKYRMTEGNTCYRGGKPGMSDSFGAALWAADLLPSARVV